MPTLKECTSKLFYNPLFYQVTGAGFEVLAGFGIAIGAPLPRALTALSELQIYGGLTLIVAAGIKALDPTPFILENLSDRLVWLENGLRSHTHPHNHPEPDITKPPKKFDRASLIRKALYSNNIYSKYTGALKEAGMNPNVAHRIAITYYRSDVKRKPISISGLRLFKELGIPLRDADGKSFFGKYARKTRKEIRDLKPITYPESLEDYLALTPTEREQMRQNGFTFEV